MSDYEPRSRLVAFPFGENGVYVTVIDEVFTDKTEEGEWDERCSDD